MGCNYLSLPLIPDSGTTLLVYIVHPIKYAHSLVLLYFDLFMFEFSVDSYEMFTHILQGCFTSNRVTSVFGEMNEKWYGYDIKELWTPLYSIVYPMKYGHTIMLCFVSLWLYYIRNLTEYTWLTYLYYSGLLPWHWANHIMVEHPTVHHHSPPPPPPPPPPPAAGGGGVVKRDSPV